MSFTAGAAPRHWRGGAGPAGAGALPAHTGEAGRGAACWAALASVKRGVKWGETGFSSNQTRHYGNNRSPECQGLLRVLLSARGAQRHLAREASLDAFGPWRNHSPEAMPLFLDLSSPIHSLRRSKERQHCHIRSGQLLSAGATAQQHNGLEASWRPNAESKTIPSVRRKQR